MTRMPALVLAGTRPGGDPLAQREGVSHKALIDISGTTMLERVVGALAAAPSVGAITVAIEQPALLSQLPGLEPAGEVPITTVRPDATGPSATVGAALGDTGTPLLATTADNALLRPEWIEEFIATVPPAVDLAAALAPRKAVEAAAPGTRRTWLRFSDGDFSGCNLFLFAGPAAIGAVTLWRELESHRKNPLRMIARLGWTFALRYRLGMLSSSAVAARLGALSGTRIAFVMLRDGRAAIDVDKHEDLVLVRQLIADRAARPALSP